VNEQAVGFRETRLRSFTKTITWRSCALTNSYLVLLASTSTQPLVNALAMNVTGFLLFYLFERVWNLIHWGRIPLEMSGSGTAETTS
jgi:uncharacterized membrane protein